MFVLQHKLPYVAQNNVSKVSNSMTVGHLFFIHGYFQFSAAYSQHNISDCWLTTQSQVVNNSTREDVEIFSFRWKIRGVLVILRSQSLLGGC